jgi:uncharacterized membrane protein YvlD (DUF360 family)
MGLPGGVELLIIGLFLVVVPFPMAYWVYNDAENRGDDRAAFWTLAVGGILALVVSVWQR